MRRLMLTLTPALPIQYGHGGVVGVVVKGVDSADAGLHLTGTGSGKTTN